MLLAGLRMLRVMSDENLLSKVTNKNGNKRAVEDRLNGDGGKVMALAMIALGIWFVVSLFWH